MGFHLKAGGATPIAQVVRRFLCSISVSFLFDDVSYIDVYFYLYDQVLEGIVSSKLG